MTDLKADKGNVVSLTEVPEAPVAESFCVELYNQATDDVASVVIEGVGYFNIQDGILYVVTQDRQQMFPLANWGEVSVIPIFAEETDA